jgi:hypothetical protein
MKTITRTKIYLPMAGMILTAALAVPAAAQQQVLFMGVLQGVDHEAAGPSPDTVVQTTTGTGIGALVGQFSLTQVHTIAGGTGSAGSAHWIAANGDGIDTTFTASGKLAETPGFFRLTEIHTITGGTGRFDGAQGSFTLERLHNGDTHLTSGVFYGTITPPGAAH